MPGSYIGGTSPVRTQRALTQRHARWISKLTWTQARSILGKIDVSLPPGTTTERGHELVRQNIAELRNAGLVGD